MDSIRTIFDIDTNRKENYAVLVTVLKRINMQLKEEMCIWESEKNGHGV